MKQSFVIDGFEKLTQQELFDKAAHHVQSNGRPSVRADNSCTYGGIGCAAAVFIKPEYREELRGSWPPAYREKDMGMHDYALPSHQSPLIKDLQFAHDYASKSVDFMAVWKVEMQKVAAKYSLSTAALK